jgi:hypothetical protein
MRIFVKDEHKFEAAKYAFEQTCKKFSSQLKDPNTKDFADADSPVKDRHYASQKLFSR